MSAIDDLNQSAVLALRERALAGLEAMESLLGVAMEIQELLQGMAMLRVDFELPVQPEEAEEAALTREPSQAGMTATLNLDLAFSALEQAFHSVEEKGAPINQAIANFYSLPESTGADTHEGPIILQGQQSSSHIEAISAAREAIRSASEKERMERQAERSEERTSTASTVELTAAHLTEELSNASRAVQEMESISERVSGLSQSIISSPVITSARPYPGPSGAGVPPDGIRQMSAETPVAGRSLELRPFTAASRLSRLDESVTKAEKASSSIVDSALSYRREASARSEEVATAIAASMQVESMESPSLDTSTVSDYLLTAQTLSSQLSEASAFVDMARDSLQEATAPALAFNDMTDLVPGDVRLPPGAGPLSVYHDSAIESFNNMASTALVQMIQAAPQMAPIRSLPQGVSPASSVAQALSMLPERIQEIARASTFNNTFNIIVNVKGGSEESEMKELGKKIGEILSEELRRYGGVTR